MGKSFRISSKIFREVDPVICGVVRAELLRGAFSLINLDDISELLDNLEMISFPETEWNNFGRMLYKFRIHGITVPFQDAMIAYTAIYNNIPVLTRDKHFKLIQDIMPELKLFPIPTKSTQ